MAKPAASRKFVKTSYEFNKKRSVYSEIRGVEYEVHRAIVHSVWRETIHRWIDNGMTSKRAPLYPAPAYMIDLVPLNGRLTLIQLKLMHLLSALCIEANSRMIMVKFSDMARFANTTNSRARNAVEKLMQMRFELVHACSRRSDSRKIRTLAEARFIGAAAVRPGEVDLIVMPGFSAWDVTTPAHYTYTDMAEISAAKTMAEIVLKHAVKVIAYRSKIDGSFKQNLHTINQTIPLSTLRGQLGTLPTVRNSAFVKGVSKGLIKAGLTGRIDIEGVDVSVLRTKANKERDALTLKIDRAEVFVERDFYRLTPAELTSLRRQTIKGTTIREAVFIDTATELKAAGQIADVFDVRRSFQVFAAANNLRKFEEADLTRFKEQHLAGMWNFYLLKAYQQAAALRFAEKFTNDGEQMSDIVTGRDLQFGEIRTFSYADMRELVPRNRGLLMFMFANQHSDMNAEVFEELLSISDDVTLDFNMPESMFDLLNYDVPTASLAERFRNHVFTLKADLATRVTYNDLEDRFSVYSDAIDAMLEAAEAESYSDWVIDDSNDDSNDDSMYLEDQNEYVC